MLVLPGRIGSGLAVCLLAIGMGVEGGVAQDVDFSAIGYVVGDPDAPVAVIELGDYACSACAEFHRDSWPEVKRTLVDSGVVLWRHVPFLLGFRRGKEGAKAAHCAADQGAYWPMHDVLYRAQRVWTDQRRPKGMLAGYAAELGMDAGEFERCFDDDDPKERIEAANRAAKELGVRATPTFYIDGVQVQGALPAEVFIQLVRAAEAQSAG